MIMHRHYDLRQPSYHACPSRRPECASSRTISSRKRTGCGENDVTDSIGFQRTFYCENGSTCWISLKKGTIQWTTMDLEEMEAKG